MKKFLSIAAVALMAMSAMSLSSCSKDDDDNDSSTNQVKYTSSAIDTQAQALGIQTYFGTRLGGTADSTCLESNKIVIYAQQKKKDAVEKILKDIESNPSVLQKAIHDQDVTEAFSFTFMKDGDSSVNYSYTYKFPFIGIWGCVLNNVTYTYTCNGRGDKKGTLLVNDPTATPISTTYEASIGTHGSVLTKIYAITSVCISDDLQTFTCKIGKIGETAVEATFTRQ